MQPKLISKKAQFKNYAEDGIKIRSNQFKNKAKYDRKDKTWKKEYDDQVPYQSN